MRIIIYTIILSFTIFNPTQAWWSWIEDTVNTIKTAAGEFASWGDALTDANIPILSDVAGAADIYKGWVEDGFDKATGELGVDFEDALDLARRLVSLTDALPDISGAVKTALDPVFNEIKGKIDVVTDIPKAIYYGTTNSRRRLNDDGNRNSSRRRLLQIFFSLSRKLVRCFQFGHG